MKYNKNRYTKEQVESIVKDCFHMAEVCRQLNIKPAGGNYKTLKLFISKNEIDILHFRGMGWRQKERFVEFGKKYDLCSILVKESTYTNSNVLRQRLIKEGVKEYKCENCNNTEWMGKPIPLELDHIDGDNRNNTIENLRILCPNCHAQTSTYRGKGIKVKVDYAAAMGGDLS